MKNIFRIFKRDMKNIFTNWVATVVVIALMIIPSLYSLFNIKASWDPYESTGGIKIAVINEDKGTVFKDEDINLGNELVENLQDNDKMGWVFVDKKTGENGLLYEKYYATIEIPEDFSKDVITLVEKDVVKPKLIYTVNEKINAIAPKMTDAGVKTVKGQIDENIVKTVSGIMFRVLNEVGINIENNRPELRNIIDSVYELDDNMPELESVINGAVDGTVSISDLLNKVNEIIPTLSDTIDATDDFLRNSQDFLDNTEGELSDSSPIIKEKLVSSENILDTTSIELKNIDENVLPEVSKKTLLLVSDSSKATSTSIEDINSKLNSIRKFLDKVSKIQIPKPNIIEDASQTAEQIEAAKKAKEAAEKQAKALKSMQKDIKDTSKKISEIIERLDTINDNLQTVIARVDEEIDRLDNGGKIDIQELTDIRKLIDDTHILITKMVDGYDSEFVPAIKSGFDSIKTISDNTLYLLEQTRGTLPDVENLLNTFINTSDLSHDQLVKLKDKFPDIKEDVHKLADKLREIDDNEKIDELLELITNNWNEQSNFLASPVEIEDNRLFPWPNYGSTVTPFYTVLCLWIGAYMLSILLGTDAKPLEEGNELKPYEVYFGKMLLFLFIGTFQAIIASGGALLILHSYSVHPIMYVFYTIYVSIVFMIIIYTAVSVFGNAGIILGVVLLVLQVAGTSGNFPIEVNPKFFQILYPVYPFTYAISGMRQVMAGIVYSILFKDTAILCGFLVCSIIIGILFKDITNKKRAGLVEKLHESTIMN